ncbi:hypothetical protein, partial [Mesorhizobium sp.]|uniref:hypothetical protein n=1 Tax=Mesorhizobium sp. TaxID=1871066 RepID=UPI0025C24BAE
HGIGRIPKPGSGQKRGPEAPGCWQQGFVEPSGKIDPALRCPIFTKRSGLKAARAALRQDLARSTKVEAAPNRCLL